MSMNHFYSRLASPPDQEADPLFAVLQRLQGLDPRRLLAGWDDSNTWSPWDPTGSPPDLAPPNAA